MLSEIKARYSAQCAKCGRDIREGWTVYFEPNGKKVYCKPCGQPMWAKEQNADSSKSEGKTSEAMKVLEDLLAQSLLHGEILARIEENFRDLNLDIQHLDSFLRGKEKPAKKKD